MIKSSLVLVLLLSLQVVADEFKGLDSKPVKIECSNKNQVVQFAGTKSLYTLYDKNSSAIKLLNCEKIQIKDLVFYTVLFSQEIREGATNQKVLSYEVALVAKTGTILTVRSELVDQIELTGDLINTNFDSAIHVAWGQSKKDNRVLLKVEIKTKNEKPLAYVLKLNPKMLWFENLFEKK